MNRRLLVRMLAWSLTPTLFVAAPAHSAGGGESEWAKPKPSVAQKAEAIVDSAPAGEPLRVVTTTITDHGPAFESVEAPSPQAAEEIVTGEQDKPRTLAVSMEQPVRIAVAGDPLRGRQWALTTLHAESVWAISKGSGVTVAVVDTGVQANHPDLTGQVLAGYNVLSKNTNVADTNGHGTDVAGIIAAKAGNGIGTAGLAPLAKILPVKVFNDKGVGTTTDVAAGITWAANHGANVINLSMVGGNDPAMQTAIQYAQSKNIVVVAAGGNKGCGTFGSEVAYPAAYPGVLGVGSVDSDGDVSGFSSCGAWIDVAAPGSHIWSTLSGSAYVAQSGTSMASPYVAALAALAFEQAGTGRSADSISGLIEDTAGDRGAPGRDRRYGTGLIDPLAALARISGDASASGLPVVRLAGADRYQTAATISKATFSPGVAAVFIAAGNYFADGLTAGPAAAKLGAPLLLVPGDRVPATVSTEIRRLEPAHIYVLGGTGVVSAKVAGRLGDFAPVSRLAGADRYATSARVAQFWTNANTVYVASGAMFADALSGGAAAARAKMPLLSTSPTRLSAPTREALQRLHPSRVVIVGGPAAVSNGVKASIEAAVPTANVSRVGGKNRYETSAKLALTSAGAGAVTVMVASGENFPDALSGVPASAALSEGFVISHSHCMPPSVSNGLNRDSIGKYVLLGGSAVLSTAVATRVCA